MPENLSFWAEFFAALRTDEGAALIGGLIAGVVVALAWESLHARLRRRDERRRL